MPLGHILKSNYLKEQSVSEDKELIISQLFIKILFQLLISPDPAIVIIYAVNVI